MNFLRHRTFLRDRRQPRPGARGRTGGGITMQERTAMKRRQASARSRTTEEAASDEELWRAHSDVENLPAALRKHQPNDSEPASSTPPPSTGCGWCTKKPKVFPSTALGWYLSTWCPSTILSAATEIHHLEKWLLNYLLLNLHSHGVQFTRTWPRGCVWCWQHFILTNQCTDHVMLGISLEKCQIQCCTKVWD